MNNWQKFRFYLILSVKGAFLFGIPGTLIGSIVLNSSNPDERILAGGGIGLFIGGAGPFIICMWFLFLHMIGQLVSAIRDGNDNA